MQYFRTTFREADLAMQTLWAREDEAELPRTSVHVEALGQDSFMCVTSTQSENRLRKALVIIGANFTENTEKPVLTGQPVS